MRYDADRFNRFCARHSIQRKHVLLVVMMATGHKRPIARLLLDFARGIGPAAIAAGRAAA